MTARVAHVLRKYDPEEWGGIETHVAAITRRLGPLGWPSEVHAPAGPRASDRALAPEVPLRRYHSFLPVLGSPARRRGLIANAGNIVSLDELVRLLRDEELELVHLHTMGRIGGAVRTAMRRTARPYVVSVHGPLLAQRGWLEEDGRRRRAGTLDLGQPFGALLGARHVLEDAARVIVFNEEERAVIAERIGERVVRMDHGVDAPRFAAGDGARARERLTVLHDAPAVLVVGRLCAQKNQLLAVRAFARGAPPDHHLVLAGADTDVGYRGKVEREASGLGIADRVHVLGNVPSPDLADLYAAATLVMVPSTQEAFGLIVLEAMAASRPVLFAVHSGLADIARALGDHATVVDDMEAGSWAAALRALLADAPRQQASVEAALALVRRRYDWDAVTHALAALYEEVVAEAARRPAAVSRAPSPRPRAAGGTSGARVR